MFMPSPAPLSDAVGFSLSARAALSTRAKEKAKFTLFSAAVLICCWAAGLQTAVAQSALDGFDPNANGTIDVVVVQPDGKILIGGDFTTLSPNGGPAVTRNYVARLNPDGTLDDAFDPSANNQVNAIAVQSDGKILVGGYFNGANSIGGQTRNYIARLDPTTGLADSFNPAANNIVYAVAVQADGNILAVGAFNGTNSIGGQTRNYIARLDPTTGLADSFDPNANNIPTEIVVQPDGKILVGGNFTNIGGLNRGKIARLDATTGLADSFDPGANNTVESIAVQADGRVWAGGIFSNIGGQTRKFIARLDAATGLADSFDLNANGAVYSIAVQADGRVLAGGDFTNIGGQTRNFIARLDPTTGLADSFDPNAASNVVNSIAVQPDGKILAGGAFTSLSPDGGATVTRNRIARLEPDGRLDQTLDLGIVGGGDVRATAVQPDGKILIGGDFITVLGVTRNNIARLNTDGTLDMAFDPNANNTVYAIALQADGKILAVGSFAGANSIGGQMRNHIARLDATTGLADSFDPNADNDLLSIAVQPDGKILAGGVFTTIGGQPRNHIARLDATTGAADLTFDPNASDLIDSIAVQADGKILAGGNFITIGGQPRNFIGRLDVTTGLADSFNPNANSQVFSILVQADGEILAGGVFSIIGGQPRNFIARLDATTGAADSFDPNANNGVDSIAVQTDGKILAGGSFHGANSIGGQTRNFIARLDATTGAADPTFNPNANNTVGAIAVLPDGKVLAGGSFTGANSIGGQTRNLFARLTNDTAALQNLGMTQTTITWTRGGSSPQFTRVTFEYSTDNVGYSSLGSGTAAGNNWTLTGLNLSTGKNIYIRARGYYRGGFFNNSESITESVRNAFLPGPTATGSSISGTVTTIDGAPLGGVIVSLAGARSGVTITNAAGFYAFPDLASGGFYTVTPWLANYSFGPQTRSFSLIADLTDTTFTAIPSAIPTANPLDTPPYFVRQQYLDFLGREPDPDGLAYWTSQLNQCGSDANCLNQQRISVSAAFFMSDEFQQTASFVYRIYQGALGRAVSYAEFSADRQQLAATNSNTAGKLNQLTAAFTHAFVLRSEFMQKYQGAITAETFVDALVQTIRQSAGVDLSAQRSALFATYNTSQTVTESRTLTVQAAVDNAAFTAAEYNPGFVLTQYSGYLRRDPDQAGYDFWLNVLNNAPTNYRGMVCSFVTSAEYQQRFAPVVTHTNAECGP
jgi:uncharacterized delta-60 repeat protein